MHDLNIFNRMLFFNSDHMLWITVVTEAKGCM